MQDLVITNYILYNFQAITKTPATTQLIKNNIILYVPYIYLYLQNEFINNHIWSLQKHIDDALQSLLH